MKVAAAVEIFFGDIDMVLDFLFYLHDAPSEDSLSPIGIPDSCKSLE